jgi:subtilisin family serine protease
VIGTNQASAETSIGIAHGMSWGHPKRGRLLKAAVALLAPILLLATPAASAPRPDGPTVSVIVRERLGAGRAPELAVRFMGGRVGRHIGIINGFVAQVPAGGTATLLARPDVHSVTPDGRVRLLLDSGGFDGAGDPGSMYSVAQLETQADEFWSDGYTGAGVDVALIDSGVVPVDGLAASGKVINGADLSFESQSKDLRYLDTFGHGTHMAGIIAGRDNAIPPGTRRFGSDSFVGMAPDARIVNVKVADVNGVTDVSQVLAAIDWVVQHRQDNGMNIRVLNLSFGTDGVQDYVLDPLTYAAEVAWRKGIVVVVAAGNRGFGSPRLNNPAYDPYVIAVGAADPQSPQTHVDDEVAEFSSCGSASRHPDLIAPGKSVVSLRDPGSGIDVAHPEGRVRGRFFRGSGTSQAAAVVSGAAALIIDQRPSISPDQVKELLTSSAHYLYREDPNCEGAGMLNLRSAIWRPTPWGAQSWPVATGLGSLEAARGSVHVEQNGVPLVGQQDIFGTPWDSKSWSIASWLGQSWLGGRWNSKSWSGDSWSGMSWSGRSWSTAAWPGMSWSGMSWSGMSWSGMSWSGMSWSGMSWSGMSWSGMSWSGMSWSGDLWSSSAWGS